MPALPPLVQRPPELMDDPSLDASQHEEALRALARIHMVSRTASQLASCLVALTHNLPSTAGQTLRILDIACGGGDLTTSVAARVARKVPHRIEFIGLDISERAIGWATRNHARATEKLDVTFRTCDVLNGELPSCTLAFHSLFLHHLDDVQAVAQLRAMAAAAQGGVATAPARRAGALAADGMARAAAAGGTRAVWTAVARVGAAAAPAA